MGRQSEGRRAPAHRVGWRTGVSAVAVAATIAAGPLPAQTVSASNVTVQGNQRIDASTILETAEIAGAGGLDTAELNAAYQRLVQSGLFENVELERQGGGLVIHVDERPTINVISIEGNERLSDEDLATVVQSQPRRVFSPVQAEQDADRLADAYRQAGRLSAEVEPRVIRRSENRVDLVFEITEGRVVENERISFVGNRTYSDGRLRRVIATKQAGWLRRLFSNDSFIAERIELDRQLLNDFYQSRGYPDFRILDINTEVSRQRDATFLTFNIQEGQRYEFGRITGGTDIPGLDVQDYLDVATAQPGGTYTPTAVENTIARMERLAVRQGRDFIRVEPRVTRDERNLALDIEFFITRGPRVFVERIDIEGNQTTLDRVIRREFDTVEGDPFNPREIRAAAERIRALNYFSNVEVNAVEGSTEDQVLIDVNVEEEPTGSLSFGANYGTDDGLGFAIGFSERNFLGRGQRLRLDIDTGSDNATSRLSFTEPYILARDVAFRFDLLYATTERNNADYDTTIARGSPSLTFPVSRNGRLEVRYTISSDKISDVDEDSSPILKEEEGKLYTSSVGYTYSYDTRRTGLDPTGGILFRFGQDFAGVGGDVQYVKTTAELTGQKMVRNEEITLRATIEGGSLHMLGGDEGRLTDRFFLSTRQLRGFAPRGVGPRDLNVDNEDALGGNLYAVARFETEFPLGTPEEYGISGGAFLDVGSVWSLEDVDGGVDGDDGNQLVDDDFALRASIGVSLFWDTPLGPLRFNFSQPLVKEDYDDEQNFQFAISTDF